MCWLLIPVADELMILMQRVPSERFVSIDVSTDLLQQSYCPVGIIPPIARAMSTSHEGRCLPYEREDVRRSSR